MDSWSTLTTQVPVTRFAAASVEVSGKILLIGGLTLAEDLLTSVAEFSPATETWSLREPTDFTERILLGATVVDGTVYAIGGRNAGGSPLSVVQALTIDLVQDVDTDGDDDLDDDGEDDDDDDLDDDDEDDDDDDSDDDDA